MIIVSRSVREFNRSNVHTHLVRSIKGTADFIRMAYRFFFVAVLLRYDWNVLHPEHTRGRSASAKLHFKLGWT